MLINSSFAQNVVKLNEGSVAPFTGALVSDEKFNDLVKAKKKVIVLEDLRAAQEELIEHHKQAARVARTELSKAQFRGFWTNTGYFVLGAILTGFAFKVNQKIGDI